MTLEQLLNSSASELERLTDAELEAFFAPVLHITRPERAQVQRNTKHLSKSSLRDPNNAGRKMALSMLAGMGVDLDDLE